MESAYQPGPQQLRQGVADTSKASPEALFDGVVYKVSVHCNIYSIFNVSTNYTEWWWLN